MIPDFIHAHRSFFIWLTSLSALTFFGTILAIPLILIKMSSDYFANPHRTPFMRRRHPVYYHITEEHPGFIILFERLFNVIYAWSGIADHADRIIADQLPGQKKP